MNIKTYGTAFTSYDVKANKQTKEQLVNENVSFHDDINKTNEIENISYHTTTESSTAKPTVFKDPTNDKYVITSLDDTTIEKLKTHFSEDDFIEKEDGSIRLTGDAEAFVSGWFGDIAYKRDFLEADVNDDGEISKSEYSNVKNSYNSDADVLIMVDGTSKKIASFQENVTEQYVTLDTGNITYRNHQDSEELPSSLDDELNMTLILDKNFDGIMTLTESYLETDESKQDTVMSDLKSLGETAEPMNNSSTGLIDILIGSSLDKFVNMSDDERAEHLEEMALKRKEKAERLEEVKQEKKDTLSDKVEDDLIEFRIEEIVAMMIEKENQKSLENMELDIYV